MLEDNGFIAYIRQPLPRPVGFDLVGVQITTAIAIDPRDHNSCGTSTHLSLLTRDCKVSKIPQSR